MEEALVARLRANAPLGALVADRIDWAQRPPGDSLPGVVMRVVGAGQDYDHEGEDRLCRPRVRADSWGRTYSEAKRVARAFRAAITTPAVHGGIDFQRGFLVVSVDFGPEDIPGGEKAFRVTEDFILWWRPAS